MPTEAYALCQIVPHVTEKGYTYSVSSSRTVQPSFQSLYCCCDRVFLNLGNQITFYNMDTEIGFAIANPKPSNAQNS
jgi:hypothetical protein